MCIFILAFPYLVLTFGGIAFNAEIQIESYRLRHPQLRSQAIEESLRSKNEWIELQKGLNVGLRSRD